MFTKLFALFTGRSASASNPIQTAAPVQTAAVAVAVEEAPKEMQTVFSLRQFHDLSRLEQSGCKRTFGEFNDEGARSSYNRMPGRVHLIRIPEWKKMEWTRAKYWAPFGYRPLGLNALTSFGVEYPEVQKSLVIVATAAVDEPGPSSAIYYLYLSANKEGERIIDTPNWGVCWTGDNGKEGEESNFYGIFEKATPDTY